MQQKYQITHSPPKAHILKPNLKMKFTTALTILTTMGSSAYVQARPTSDNVFTMTKAKPSSDNVFTMTNAEAGNEVLMYNRNPDDGTIAFVKAFATGKRLGWQVNFQTSRINNALITFLSSPSGGIGNAARAPPPTPPGTTASQDDPLGSQEPIVVSPNGRCLFAVNAGSDTVTSFIVKKNSLKLSNMVDTNGNFPVSMAVSDDLLFVLNAGDGGIISGFEIGKDCKLSFGGTTTALMADQAPDPTNDGRPVFIVAPSQISFTPDGNFLIAIVKGLIDIGLIWVFPVPDASSAELGNGVPTESEGFTPFSFDFDSNGNLLVAEGFGTAPNAPADGGATMNAGAVSSYSILTEPNAVGELLEPISISVGNNQTATCWLKFDGGSCAFTTNNVGNTVSSYSVNGEGQLSLKAEVAAELDSPIDLSIVDDFLYVLSTNHKLPDADPDRGRPSIYVFEIDDAEECSIKLLEVLFVGLPDELTTVFGAVGMVATNNNSTKSSLRTSSKKSSEKR
jgi:6-phosphogluconolactonase (cycloisomerase 2 family)